MSNLFTDTTEMPFGKYKGQKLANVPADYLLWFYDNNKWMPTALKKYVESNLDVLRKEAKK